MVAKKYLQRALFAALTLAVILVLAYWAALHLLRQQIVKALGADAEVQSVDISFKQIDIRGLHLRADSPVHKHLNWPVGEEFSADMVSVEPDLRSLLSDTIVIRAIHVEHGQLPILRTAKGVQIVPGLRSQGDKKEPASASASSAGEEQAKRIRIGSITLRNSEIDYYDATVARKAHLIPLRNIEARFDDLMLPDMSDKSTLAIRAEVGDKHPGSLQLAGNLTVATRDSQLKLNLRDVPLALIEPYLIKAADSHVKRGTLSLTLDSTVNANKLRAPGTISLDHMELAGNGGFGGIAREAVVALLRDKRERIDLSFTLQGNLDDPKFSLNEELYTRFGSALAESVGIGFENLGKGAGSVTQGIGNALKSLFK